MSSMVINIVGLVTILAVGYFLRNIILDYSSAKSEQQFFVVMRDHAENGLAISQQRKERLAAAEFSRKQLGFKTQQLTREMELQHNQRMADIEKQYGTSESETWSGRKAPRVVGESSTNEITRVDRRLLN